MTDGSTEFGSTDLGSAGRGSTDLGSGTLSGSDHVAATGLRDERSLGEVVSDLSSDLSTLLQQEMALAKAELKEEVSKTGKGAGMLGGAGLAGWFVLIFASLALTFLLDDWLPLEAAAIITAAIWAVIAAVLALKGRQELRTANPQLPTTQQTIKEDVAWAKAQKS